MKNKKTMDKKSLIKKLMKGYWTLEQLGITKGDVRALRDEGFRVQCQRVGNERVYYLIDHHEMVNAIISTSTAREKFRWLELSDIHAGSKQFDEQGLRFVLKRALDDGIKDVHLSGDLTDGIAIYHGHLTNLRYWTMEEQAMLLAEILSEFPFRYFACHGN